MRLFHTYKLKFNRLQTIRICCFVFVLEIFIVHSIYSKISIPKDTTTFPSYLLVFTFLILFQHVVQRLEQIIYLLQKHAR